MQQESPASGGSLLLGSDGALQGAIIHHNPPEPDTAYNSSDIPQLTEESETSGRARSNSVVFSGEQYIKIDTPVDEVDDESRRGTVLSSIITLTTTAAGAGILTLPVALKDAGLVGGLVTLMVCAVVSDYSMLQLVRASQSVGAASYREVGVKTWGPWMGTVVDVSMLALLLGASIVFLIIMVDNDSGFPAIFSRWLGSGSFLADRFNVLAISVGCMYPLTLLSSLHALRYTSVLALGGLVYVFCYMAYFFGDHGVTDNTVNMFEFGKSFWIAVPMQATAFCAHFNVIPLANEIAVEHSRIETSMSKVIHVSIMLVLFMIYALFSLIGYLSFGNQVADNILSSKFSESGDDNMVLVGRVCIAVVMGLKFPLISLPFRDLFNEVCIPASLKPDESATHLSKMRFIAIEMLLFCGLVFFVGWKLDQLQTALGLLGATAGNMLSFVLPGLFGIKIVEKGTRSWYANVCMVVFGIVSGLAGLITGLINAV